MATWILESFMVLNNWFFAILTGTISTEDLGYILLTHFSQEIGETIDRQFCEGKSGVHTKGGTFSGKAEKHLETPR